MEWTTILVLALGLLVEGKNYVEVLEDERIEDVFELLQAKDLLKGNRAERGECTRDLNALVLAVERKEKWAMRMLDSSSRVPVGIREGNIIELGNFDECVGAQGRHCMFAVNPMIEGNSLPYHPTMSICLPNSCDGDDVLTLVGDAINGTEKLRSYGAHVTSANCTSNDKPFFDRGLVIWSSFMTVYVGFLILCTVIELMEQKTLENPKSDTLETLTRFSLWKNAKKLFSTKVQDNNLPFLHGIRVLSTAWIILFHEYFLRFFMANANLVYIPEWFFSWRSSGAIVANMSVDTFFTISGFLMTYTFIHKMKRGERFNVLHYYLHRFIRLTLPMAMVIVSTTIVFPKIATGPRWEWFLRFGIDGARTNWWSSLLYIQNFVDRNDFRLLHLWSLCVDMQLFWISPLILYPLYKNPKRGLFIVAVLIAICTGTSAYVVGANGYPTLYLTYKNIDINFAIEGITNVYLMPYTRASPWLLGIVLGYIATKDSTFKISKKFVFLGWFATFTTLITMLLALSIVTGKEHEYSFIQDATFTMLVRPAWSLMTCWLIYACINNVAGPVSSILSWKFFLPLSRISYCVYLVHLMFPALRVGTTRGPTYFDDLSIFRDYVSDLVMSVGFGFVYSLLFEVPMVVLEGVIFRRKKKAIEACQKTQL